LAKCLGPVLILLELLPIYRWFSSRHRFLDIIQGDLSNIDFIMIFKVQPGLRLSVLIVSARRPFSILQLFELLGQLQSSDWLIHCITDQDINVASGVIFSSGSKSLHVRFCKTVRSILEPLL
jgi:hypothetical protein